MAKVMEVTVMIMLYYIRLHLCRVEQEKSPAGFEVSCHVVRGPVSWPHNKELWGLLVAEQTLDDHQQETGTSVLQL